MTAENHPTHMRPLSICLGAFENREGQQLVNFGQAVLGSTSSGLAQSSWD